MTTEIVRSNLADQMAYAQAVVARPEGGAQSLLPAAYRGNPANVLIAMGLGQALGLTPAQALYDIYVVNGRPSPSANLLAGLVRRAGHKLRIDGDATRCTATLIRSDDPDAPFDATWTIDQARAAGLAGKDTWKQYPAAMLRARAISEVVRMGASEVILGMEYSAEEMRDIEPDAPVATVKTPGLAGLRAAVQTSVETSTDPVDAEEVDDDPETGEAVTPAQLKALHAAMGDIGLEDRDRRLEYASRIIGRDLGSSKDLTKREASLVIDAAKADAAGE